MPRHSCEWCGGELVYYGAQGLTCRRCMLEEFLSDYRRLATRRLAIRLAHKRDIWSAASRPTWSRIAASGARRLRLQGVLHAG
jgi:hypothetical protein